MSFSELLNRVAQDTVGHAPLRDLARVMSGQQPSFIDGSLLMFLPELILVATVLGLLFVRLLDLDKRLPGQSVALLGTTLALIVAVMQFIVLKSPEAIDPAKPTFLRVEYFTGLLVFDAFAVFFKIFLLLFAQLVVYLTRLSGIPDQEDAPDFYTLLLGSTLGALVLVGANHLLMVFLAIEMMSVPSYAMVGFLKGRKTSSEASFKYVVYGAGAAGVMLYGISLLCGLLGTGSLPEITLRLGMVFTGDKLVLDPTLLTLLLGLAMVLVGLAFKLSVFPFHFWCPDAFEGAAAEVAGFLSVASKGAVFALLVRICLALSGLNNEIPPQLVAFNLYLGICLGVLAAVTATFGNLAAYSQTNIKRLLAYSTIAHAGYMLMAIAALLVFLNGSKQTPDPEIRWSLAMRAVEGLMFYLCVYLFMNLGAFSVAAFVRNELYSENITDYGGLWTQSPALAVAMTCCMFSLVGIPPFGGFFGKFMIFSSLFQAGFYHWAMWGVLVLAGMNTVFSLFYYVRVLKFMFFEPANEGMRKSKLSSTSTRGLFVLMIAVFVLLTGVLADPLSSTVQLVSTTLFP